MEKESTRVYDANNAIVGRLAAKVAKRALLGENIVVINAEKAIITGDRLTVIKAFKQKRQIRTSFNPLRGPFHERRTDRIVRRVIRGMLPHPTPRGKAAWKRIRVYMGVPKEYEDTKAIVLEDCIYNSTRQKFIRISEVSHELGWGTGGKE